MPFRPDNLRPRAGIRFAGNRFAGNRFVCLALLAVLTLLGSPLATVGHHHHDDASHADDASCSVCLWQAHHAADLAVAPRAGAPMVAALEAAAAVRRHPAVAPLRLSARAPPAASV